MRLQLSVDRSNAGVRSSDGPRPRSSPNGLFMNLMLYARPTVGRQWQRSLVLGWLVLTALIGGAEEDESPFRVTVTLERSGEKALVQARFEFPAGHYLYADKLHFQAGGSGSEMAFDVPQPSLVTDKHSQSQKSVHLRPFVASRALDLATSGSLSLQVSWQGCSEEACFLPESVDWIVRGDGTVVAADAGAPTSAGAASASSSANAALTNGLVVLSRSTGYADDETFLRWLDRAMDGGRSVDTTALSLPVGVWSSLMTIGLILLGGLGLNLTPCVLPLIPINLAILGAGAASSNRRRGFLLGSVYGAGMALTYGLLGLTVVITGAKFGALNSSPWFNFGIAVIFGVLSLAMFDKWALDFSGLQSRMGGPGRSRRGGIFAALIMGSVAATLAGACVAPVLISVLLLSTTLYTEGNWLGVVLPFLLGLGMALPWPLAGGGLSFLPKPGTWMVRVKQAFGVLILVFAGYYAVLGWSLLPSASSTGGETGTSPSAQQSIDHFRQELDQAKRANLPIFVKFGASWCKNCTAMERTTLGDPKVVERLNRFAIVKFAAEHPSDPAIKQVLDQFGVMGLPTFLILSNQKPVVQDARIEPDGSRRL